MQKTRKLIAMLLAVMMVLSMCTVGMFSASALPEDAVISDTEGNDASSIDGELYGLMGDSDSNGKINVTDATQIQKFAAKLIELDETSTALADVDLNGKVNVKDATAIQKWVAKIAVDAPINCLVYIPTAEPTTVATEPTTIVVVPTTVASEDETIVPTTAATEDETVPVIIPTLVTEPTEAPTTGEPTEAPTTEAKPTEAPTTEAKPTEAPTTEAITTVKPTEAPEGDVIVYFQNNWMWSDVSAYAWNDDGAISKWPGEAMTFVENDGNYDIYSYVVPEGAKGILFNGTKDTDPTTRDQTPNIEEWTNGQCFYMVWDETANEGEGGNGVGSFPYVAPTEPATETTAAPETSTAAPETSTVAPETDPTETTTEADGLEAGYYLVGIIDGKECWKADTLVAERKFAEATGGDYVLYWTTVMDDEYKVAYFDGTEITKLFKAESEPNYKIGSEKKVGFCKIDFNPDGKDTSVWSYKYFTVNKTTPPVTQPTDVPETQATTVVPDTKPQLTESDYELRGSFNDWNGQAMYIAEEDGVVTLTLELAAGEYTFKIKKGDTWYGNDGKIEDTTKKTSQGGWEMSSSAGDCTLIASGGTYTFNFNTSTKKLTVLYSTEPVTEPTEATTVAPETSTAAPETSTVAPETSTVAPETSTAAPETSTVAPETSTVAPETSKVAPETSTAAPETSTVAPETSTAAPETSTVAPETSTVAPETKPTETTEPTETTKPTETTEPTETTKPTEPEAIKVYCINSAKWDVVSAYFWGGSASSTWPGKAMTKTGETVNGFDVYEYTFTAAPEKIIFNNNNKGAQTADLTFTAGQYFDVKGGKWYKSLDDVPAVSASATDRYLVGSFNGWSTTANEFLSADGKTAKVELELSANTKYEFKIVREGTWTSCKTTLNITDSATGLVFSSSVSDNTTLTTKAAGTYVFEFDLSASQLSVTYPG